MKVNTISNSNNQQFGMRIILDGKAEKLAATNEALKLLKNDCFIREMKTLDGGNPVIIAIGDLKKNTIAFFSSLHNKGPFTDTTKNTVGKGVIATSKDMDISKSTTSDYKSALAEMKMGLNQYIAKYDLKPSNYKYSESLGENIKPEFV